VLAGDFNASKSDAHLANVRRLEDRGLISAYHAHLGVEHDGVEAHPTSYYRWQESRPFHMDFVFVPRSWTIRSVNVGTFADYTGGRLSDHVPVTVSADP
jgi:endonuclease/exonuclease/phosphatase family metal-dependent hydrolase